MTAVMPAPSTSQRLRYLPIGVAASVAQALMMIPGYHEDGSFETGAWITMFIISLVVTTAVFMFAVPGGGAATALALGIVALLGTVAFWTMLSLPLAAGAGIVGLRARIGADRPRMATIAVVLAVVAVVASVVFIIGDAVNS